MTVALPEGTPTLGNTKVTILTDIPDDLEAITLAELAAGVEASCHLYPAGWAPTGTTAKGTKPTRLCSKDIVEQLNRTTWTLGDLQYVNDPQGDIGDPSNEVADVLPEDAEVVIVERRGLDAQDDDWDAGEHYRAHHIRVGAQIPSGDNTDENGEFFITQSAVYVTGKPVDGVVDAS